MTEREQIQNDLADYIRQLGYNAPYGILTNLKTVQKGRKVRVITFGMAATLDAELSIWSPKKFYISAYGPLSRYFNTSYDSVDEVKQALREAVGQ